VKAIRFLHDDPRVQSVGLVNFDTQRMEEVIGSGVKIVSNQVQFSLVDLRPTFLMGDSCKKHGVKLLTYGSLVSPFGAEHFLAIILARPVIRMLTLKSAEVS
jgi:diketogulonate reductase-like aldo/keto reductase